MKNTTSLCGCILLCSLLILFSCTKTNDNVSSELAKTGANNNSLSNAEAAAIADFVLPGDSLVIKGDTSNGDETTLLHSGYGGVSRANFQSFTALGQNFGGIDGHTRSMMKFRIRNISDSIRNNPPQVKKALLYLYQYHRPADQDPYTVTQNGDNSLELHRITGDWVDSIVTWSTQPRLASGSVNALEDVVKIPAVVTPLPPGTNDDQVVDVTDMINKIISSHNNNGFMLKFPNQVEMNYVGRAYGSMACPIASKHPKLVLYF